MKTTTLNQIKYHGPCESGWKKLLTGLGKSAADDIPLPYAEILRINGVGDALWAVRCAHFHDVIDLACRYAESGARSTTNPCAAEAVRVARGVIAGTHTRAQAAQAAQAAAQAAQTAQAAAQTAQAAAQTAQAAAQAAQAAQTAQAAWAVWAAAQAAQTAQAAWSVWAAQTAQAAWAVWAAREATGDLTLRGSVFAEWAAAPSLAP